MKNNKLLNEIQKMLEDMNTVDKELFNNLEQQKPQIQAELEEKLEKWAKDYFSEQLQEQRQKDVKLLEKYQKELQRNQKAFLKYHEDLLKLKRQNQDFKERMKRLDEKEKRLLEIIRQLGCCFGFDFSGRKSKHILKELKRSRLYIEPNPDFKRQQMGIPQMDSIFELPRKKGGQ